MVPVLAWPTTGRRVPIESAHPGHLHLRHQRWEAHQLRQDTQRRALVLVHGLEMQSWFIYVLVPVAAALSASSAVPPRRIAVLGGGLAGLGIAVPLLERGNIDALHVYDAEPPGCGGASAVAAGLLHPFTRKGREVLLGREGYAATARLVERCEEVLGEQVSRPSGLLRLALDAELAGELQHSSTGKWHEGVHSDDATARVLAQRWLSAREAEGMAGARIGSRVEGAAFAPAAVSIDTPGYLRGLWALCTKLAAQTGASLDWRAGTVESLAAVHATAASRGEAPYDVLVVCLGARIPELPELRGVPLRPCRGQNLYVENSVRLQRPLICGKYVVPVGQHDDGELLCGATFEYDPADTVHRGADQEHATSALVGPLAEMLPELAGARVLRCQAGVRAFPPRSHLGYVPIANRLSSGMLGEGHEGSDAAVWLFGGLGSRGLIHHALLGAMVADAVHSDDESCLHKHMRRLASRLPHMLCLR